MQVLKWGSRLTVVNKNFIEIHKYFKSKEEWERFLEDPRISIPPKLYGKEATIFILALPQMALEKKHAILTRRLYIPKELLKQISKGQWVAELVVRIQLINQR